MSFYMVLLCQLLHLSFHFYDIHFLLFIKNIASSKKHNVKEFTFLFPHTSFFCVINVPIWIYCVLINQYFHAVIKITHCNGNSSKGLLTMSGILFNSDICSIPQLTAHCGL